MVRCMAQSVMDSSRHMLFFSLNEMARFFSLDRHTASKRIRDKQSIEINGELYRLYGLKEVKGAGCGD